MVLLVDLRIRLPDLHEVWGRVLRADGSRRRRAFELQVVDGEVYPVLEPKLDPRQEELLRELAALRDEEAPTGQVKAAAPRSVFGRLRDAFNPH